MRVLIVDDEAAIRALFGEFIASVGHTPLFAENGAMAWQVLVQDAQYCDVIFSDIRMPGLGGLELLRHVRNLRPGLPFVLVSGQIDVTRDDAIRAGAFDLVRKPFRLNQIVEILKRIPSSSH